ncbi:MAG: hypothetical protein HY550_11425 [Elusimicrobia bacterium]|nr:hypothetical protein [Elusimicrobiota bacterium]
MRLKELIRVIITGEMADVSVYNVDAELYCSNGKIGDDLWELFTRIAHEKKTRLKALGKISREGVGFRQRKTEGARSIEAALRTHADRAGKSVALYRDLLKLLEKPESREAVREMILKERGFLAALTELRNRLKEPG